ncbi:MAG: TetR family transcriptional regulator [Proteobacteria bacterium]|nr:TetR family transcriptional regulator [Pseudomonadota bacterium]
MSTVTQEGSRRKRLPTAERQQEVIAVVLELARTSSPEGITTQAIADRVGITQGALFKHFPDKQALWIAVFDWVQEQLGAAIRQGLQGEGDALARLQRVFLAHVGFVAHHPGAPRILFYELQRPTDSPFQARARDMMGAYRQRLCALFEEASRSGQLSPTLDVKMAALLLIGTIQGLVMQSALFRNEAEMLAAAKRIFPLLLDGFRGHAANPVAQSLSENHEPA